jgi:hypothetical protein
METKKCNKCGEVKSQSDFTQSGLKVNKCKVCVSNTNREARYDPNSAKNKLGGGVYAIIRKSDCKTVYVGQTQTLAQRKFEHFNKGGKTKCSWILSNGLNPAEYEFAILNRIENETWRKRLENIYIETLGLDQKLNVL